MAIKTIAIVHHAHMDLGYTDHPDRTKIEHVKYIDMAIDYVLSSGTYPKGAQFAWTQEQLYPLRQWWEQATDTNKARFFDALATGRLEITGMPFNMTAFLDQAEWNAALHWIPDNLWNACKIRSVMQNDVNGMHTAGMCCAYNRGIRNLWIGPNSYYGVPPMPTPAAFNWQIDTDKQIFVWLNSSYNNGTFLFNNNWRQGPVPNYSDLRYRAPERGDIWASDEASVLQAHRLCLDNIALIEGKAIQNTNIKTDGFTKNRVFGDYTLQTLPVSVTNQWRVDNDPPFYPIVDFVRKWNAMHLHPELILCTATQAMDMVKAELKDDIPTYQGQWIDWWANGNASAPMEMSYNREAKRTWKVAQSPLFGPMDAAQKETARQIMENICLYDEHCFSSWQSVSDPYSFANISQSAEKNAYVYRALDGAQCLLADRARAKTISDRNKIIVFNPSQQDKVVFIELPLNCLRGEYNSVCCEQTGVRWPIHYVDGAANFLRPKDSSEFSRENVSRTFSDKCEKQSVRFGPVTLPAMSYIHLILQTAPAKEPTVPELAYTLETDSYGWPAKLQFADQCSPVINGNFGTFLSVKADGFSPRWTFKDIFENDSEQQRATLRAAHLFESQASYEQAVFTRSAGLLRFEQTLTHDSLLYGVRILTVDLINARVNLELRMNRRSDFSPEVLFLRFDAPDADVLPWISNADHQFRPELDQLPGSCMDYYAIDGWIHYPSGWLLNSVDSALVTFGSTSVVARKTSTLGPANHVYMRLFDNIWDTNFAANTCGMMRFRFSAAACVPQSCLQNVAESMQTDPVIVVKTGYREHGK